MALMIVPLIGMLSLAGETASWWMYQRAAQNAADSAAIAAATNGDSTDDGGGVARFMREGEAAAAQYGYVNGSNNATVIVNDTVACPSDTTATTCYQAQITKKVSLYLTQIVGFTGDDGAGFKLISASAIATSGGGAAPPFCIVALGTSAKKDLTINCGPNSDLPGCAVGSNGATDCNGHAITGTTASYAAAGDNNDCAANGNFQTLKSPITDPYSGLTKDVPPNHCSSYGSEGSNTQNLIAGGTNAGGVQVFCGDTELATQTTQTSKKGKTTTTTTCDSSSVVLPAGTVLVIVNGTLDICSATLDGSAGATIIFTGNSGGPSANQFISGSGTIDVSAPTSGTWAGMALYQDSNTTNVPASSITFAGNSPTFQVNGLIYTPNANVTISGDIGSAGACVGFLAQTVIINGTGNVIDAKNCAPITLTGSQFSGTRVTLVQ
jgi:Putative Flp pilus-assembly TadE/G-like